MRLILIFSKQWGPIQGVLHSHYVTQTFYQSGIISLSSGYVPLKRSELLSNITATSIFFDIQAISVAFLFRSATATRASTLPEFKTATAQSTSTREERQFPREAHV